MGSTPLSGRARTALLRHQHQLSSQVAELRLADRVLAGTLAACDAHTQHEMLLTYLETVHELHVSLQRLEAFLESRVERHVASSASRAGADGRGDGRDEGPLPVLVGAD